jgi:hypothetical protein
MYLSVVIYCVMNVQCDMSINGKNVRLVDLRATRHKLFDFTIRNNYRNPRLPKQSPEFPLFSVHVTSIMVQNIYNQWELYENIRDELLIDPSNTL